MLPDDRVQMEHAILGALSSARSDEKVRRWALASLAYVGKNNVSGRAVLRAISDYPEEPQVLAAAIATLFRFDAENAQKLLCDEASCTPELIILSALQTAEPTSLDLSDFKIDIEKADEVSLKLALVLVGLDRAIENIFDPRHSNAEIIKVLGTHHEPIVAQYSVWAAAENPDLGAKDLGIRINELDVQPPNVRSYVYRLFAEESTRTKLRHDVIVQGSQDEDDEARLGLAIGLRDSYYDGLETVTVDWLYEEEDADIRLHLLDHMVAQSERLESYKRISIEHYDFSASDARARSRMEAAAAGTSLYGDFKRMIYEEEKGLFGGNVNNYIQNINGDVQGPVSQFGDANNNGTIQAHLSEQQINEAKVILENASDVLKSVPLSGEVKEAAENALIAAKQEPNKENIGRLVKSLEVAEAAFKAVGGMAEHAVKIGTLVVGLSAFF